MGAPRPLLNDGYETLPGAVSEAALRLVAERIPAWVELPGARQRHGATFAVSGLARSDPELTRLLHESGVTTLVSSALGHDARLVDALLFDKIPESNWNVPGHRDVIETWSCRSPRRWTSPAFTAGTCATA